MAGCSQTAPPSPPPRCRFDTPTHPADCQISPPSHHRHYKHLSKKHLRNIASVVRQLLLILLIVHSVSNFLEYSHG